MADFNEAVPYVIRNEVGHAPDGGYTNDPDDPGGETKYGICRRDHPTVDIANLTLDGAVAILKAEYWDYGPLRDERVAGKLLDLAVNLEGTGKQGAAVKIAQQAANFACPETRLADLRIDALRTDGLYGPQTQYVLNLCDPDKLLLAMATFAAMHYRAIAAARPASAKYLNGWLARAQKLPVWNPAATAGLRLT